jgi:hypothetical protein
MAWPPDREIYNFFFSPYNSKSVKRVTAPIPYGDDKFSYGAAAILYDDDFKSYGAVQAQQPAPIVTYEVEK